ncbi:AGC protein kinase [Allomyces macrogynus ATCC 38327]|uniref:AGC protein kinase n=1 Tax=Allomyces macrogynus (strain ATCC 38327) TaxID=578462 RepID=A0A0L0SIN9_ALLM3|nr:AGC protein kinase [Allomyces macrogynus ATCC 38327]|eukprot:KNE62373.1 AGC protein kinase [Allomyces macrogynus ATCC 38327]
MQHAPSAPSAFSMAMMQQQAAAGPRAGAAATAAPVPISTKPASSSKPSSSRTKRGSRPPALAAAPAAPEHVHADSYRIYDARAVLEIVQATPALHALLPAPGTTDAALSDHYLLVADHTITPPLATWLYATIGLIAVAGHELDKARRQVMTTLAGLEAALVAVGGHTGQPVFLVGRRLSVADAALAVALFPAFKNLLDHDTLRHLPATTAWFFACVHHTHVQIVYDKLQAQQIAYEPQAHARRHKVAIDDYQMIKVLGKGCMGKVLLVRHKRSSNLYALKSISKSSVIVNGELNHTLAERQILTTIAQIQHPFLIQCHHAFTSESELFLVLDFVAGGDIATQLARHGRLPLPAVQLYAAEMVLGLLELHRLSIIYRDIKPENVLIAPDGHILLTDFGLSKMFRSAPATGKKSGSAARRSVQHRTRSFAGTAEYLAPEILRNEEYSFEVDWWSFGTLVYEMLAGVTPFWADNQHAMYDRILHDVVQFPPEVPPVAHSFLAGLLERNPRRRLGAGPHAAHHLQSHAFFHGLSWDDVYHKRVNVPSTPSLQSATDLSNFEECFTSMSPRLSPPSHDLSASLQNFFAGYSWAPAAPVAAMATATARSVGAGSLYGSAASSFLVGSYATRTPLAAHFPADTYAQYSGITAPTTDHAAVLLDHDDDDMVLDALDMDLDDVSNTGSSSPGSNTGYTTPMHYHHARAGSIDSASSSAAAAAYLTPTSAHSTTTLPPPVASPGQLTFHARVKKPPTSTVGSPQHRSASAALQAAQLASPTPSRPGTPSSTMMMAAPGMRGVPGGWGVQGGGGVASGSMGMHTPPYGYAAYATPAWAGGQ